MKKTQKIVIIGGHSQLGTDILKYFSVQPNLDLIPLTRDQLDLTNYDQMKTALSKLKPDIVINTAAFHLLDKVEDDPNQAFAVNAIAQKYLAELGNELHWTTVFFSTDYVFGQDTSRTKPYIETDLTGPLNIYGISKVAGEAMLQVYAQRFFIIRVSGLYGVAGSAGKGGNFVELMIKLGREKKAVKVVKDQVITPTYTLNIAENLWTLLQTENYGLYHMTSEGQCSWWEFAEEIFTQLKMKVDCQAVSSDFFPSKVQRPHFSVLENAHLKENNLNIMRDWQTNLHLYLKEKGHTQ